jgi:hypothetical protein
MPVLLRGHRECPCVKNLNRNRAPGDDDGSDNENVRTVKSIQHGTSYVLLKASNMVHLTCCKMTYKDVLNYIPTTHQEFINKLLKWVVQKQNKTVQFFSFLHVHNYPYWDSSGFVGFKERCACILQNSPRDAKCTGLFRVIGI